MSAVPKSVPKKGARILIVDDNVEAVALLVRRLTSRGFEAQACHSGAEALALIECRTPDVVLLDVDMPVMNGLQVLQHARAQFVAVELPIVMATAAEDRDVMLAAIAAGANDCVTKSIDFELLLARLAVQVSIRCEYRRAITERNRLQRRLESRGRGGDVAGDPKMRAALMDEFQRDLRADRLTLVYQPQLHLRSRDVDSAEVLLRWHSDRLGPVSPSSFIPMLEESGDIANLTQWVVEGALRAHARLAEAGHSVRLAVNLSATLAADRAFTDELLRLLEPTPDAVSLELTESAIFDDPEQAILSLGRFAEAGIRLAIDDYGTGMSSLSYIQRLPLHELKIDRMFIAKLTQSHRDPLLVRSTIELAHALEFDVVAEGVEDMETLALLSVMGCDKAQGYAIAQPLELDVFQSFMTDRRWQATAIAPFDLKRFLSNQS